MAATLTTEYRSLTFNALTGENGPYGLAVAEMQALEPDGVDGRRWRQRARRHPPFTRTGFIGAGSFTSAETLCDTAARMSGSICTLTLNSGWRGKVLAELLSCRPYASPLTTAGTTLPAHCVQEWRFTVTDDTDGAAR